MQALNLNRPIVCNEDSPRFTQLKVALKTHTSWGYYNNHTKQEPPADWSITRGEDQFFAQRMAEGIGLKVPDIPLVDQFYLQGFEENNTTQNKRWIRLASLYPERIDYVEFFRNGQRFDIAFEEPYYTRASPNLDTGRRRAPGSKGRMAQRLSICIPAIPSKKLSITE